MKKLMPALIFTILLAAFYETLVRAQVLNSYLFPSLTQIWSAFLENKTELLTAFLSTAKNSFSGFMISFIVGLILAVLISSFEVLALMILPLCLFFQTVPLIAIAPLLVVWFGFGSPTVQAASLIASFFPILANAVLGLQSINQDQLNLFKIYQASKLQILFQLRLPVSIPYIYAGLKTAAGLSIVGAIVGEFIAGGGLGGLIDTARTQQRTDLIFAALAFSTLYAFILVQALELSFVFLNRLRPFVSTVSTK